MRRELEWDEVSLFQSLGTYSTIQQIMSDYMLCAKYCAGRWESSSEQSSLRSRLSQSVSCLTPLIGQVDMPKRTSSTFQNTFLDQMLGT